MLNVNTPMSRNLPALDTSHLLEWMVDLTEGWNSSGAETVSPHQRCTRGHLDGNVDLHLGDDSCLSVGQSAYPAHISAAAYTLIE